MLNYRDALDEASKKYFDYLMTLGYTYEGVATESMNLVKDYLVVSFSNKSQERDVKIVYHPPGEGVGNVMVVDIVNTEKIEYDEFDYTSTATFHVATLRLSQLEGEFERNFESFLKKVSIDMLEKHKKILLGQYWECTPFDWQGLK